MLSLSELIILFGGLVGKELYFFFLMFIVLFSGNKSLFMPNKIVCSDLLCGLIWIFRGIPPLCQAQRYGQ